VKYQALKWILFGMALLLLAGCGTSPPTEFITLSAKPETPCAYHGLPVIVGRVRLPPQLDRLWLTRDETSDRIEVSNDTRWAAPLASLVRATLAMDLARALPPSTVIVPGEPKPRGPCWILTVVFTRFRITATDTVRLTARWSLVRRKSARNYRQHVTVKIGSRSAPAAASAVSSALKMMAAHIARTIAH
jgi:uncharacterized lipoprotein YmbA